MFRHLVVILSGVTGRFPLRPVVAGRPVTQSKNLSLLDASAGSPQAHFHFSLAFIAKVKAAAQNRWTKERSEWKQAENRRKPTSETQVAEIRSADS